MPDLVRVSSVEKLEDLKTYINDLFMKEQYAEITQAIGMYSILTDPEHMIEDQDHLYHLVLNLVKKRIVQKDPRVYSSWLIAFPAIIARLVKEGRIVTDAAAQSVLESRHDAFGPFSSLDEFFFWALDDRRLPLEQIIRYIDTTLDQHRP
jgi:hypothetical protein